MSSFPDNFSATKSSSEGTKSRGEPGVGFSSDALLSLCYTICLKYHMYSTSHLTMRYIVVRSVVA